ncbi:cyclin-dependent kinase inhibitor 1Bb [Leucoraja erinacea]|uniref:cyclin-dependent kinase inhibitor 1Bb n=1 Tax=Leucoraja erinaceus TaxID=7782 RepID=UPI002457EBB9|nr:cyclin-dependent kinase inhibitor 1Bb [Leucoraja erinacea]
MSNVRISNGSPSLELMAAQITGNAKPSACRSLFGPIDHDGLNRDLQLKKQEIHEQDRGRWNYDFERDKPLDGNYKWEAVDREDVPNFYWRPSREQVSPAEQCGIDVNGNHAIVYTGTRLQGDTDLANLQREELVTERCSSPRKRSASGDDIPDAKRLNSKTETDWSTNSPTAGTLEKTPKKTISRGHQT